MKKFSILVAALCLLPLAGCATTENGPPMSEEGGITQELPSSPENTGNSGGLEQNEAPMPKNEAPKTCTYICITASGLNVRRGADAASSSCGIAARGTLLPYAGEKGGWYETVYRGAAAYVSAAPSYCGLVSLPQGEERAEQVIEEGYSLLGTPYVYGAVRYHDGNGNRLSGFTKDKFDCSSLMQYIFLRGANVLLDVTTRTQILQGTRVDEPQRGDLLFFTNASRKNLSGIERVGHVALYLGENYILHTASDHAKIEQISAARWENFIEARRVL